MAADWAFHQAAIIHARISLGRRWRIFILERLHHNCGQELCCRPEDFGGAVGPVDRFLIYQHGLADHFISNFERLMKPRDIFKIIVATVGLIGFGYGVLNMVEGVLFGLGLSQLQHTQPGYYAARGAVEMIVGVMFMKGIPPFVDLAFPPDEPPKDENDDATPDA